MARITAENTPCAARHGAERSSRHARSGQSLTEFALVAPILLFVIYAIIQFGILMLTKSALTYATRQGARTASIHGTEATGNDQVCASIRQGLSASGVNPDNLGTVTIFKAVTPLPAPGNDNPAAHDVGSCAGGHWTYTGVAGWPFYARQNVDPPDPIGINLTYNFHFLLPIFGSGLTLPDSTILRVEPLYAMGSSGATLPTAYPTFTATPYPTYTPYPINTTLPTATCYATVAASPTQSGVPTATSTPLGSPTPTPTVFGDC